MNWKYIFRDTVGVVSISLHLGKWPMGGGKFSPTFLGWLRLLRIQQPQLKLKKSSSPTLQNDAIEKILKSELPLMIQTTSINSLGKKIGLAKLNKREEFPPTGFFLIFFKKNHNLAVSSSLSLRIDLIALPVTTQLYAHPSRGPQPFINQG